MDYIKIGEGDIRMCVESILIMRTVFDALLCKLFF